MSNLGILVTNLQQEQEYFAQIARSASGKNFNLYLFSPNDIELTHKMAKGKRFCHDSDNWITDVFSLPEFIYDRCFYTNQIIYEKHFPIVSWLKSQPDILFLGHGLPNKWIVYQILNRDSWMQTFLPETVLLTTSSQVFSILGKQTAILLKPLSGSQGKGIFVLTKTAEGFSLLAKKTGQPYYKQLTKNQLKHLLYKITSQHQYLIQPFLSLTDHQHRPFDLRIFLQKDSNGAWREIGRGIRRGRKGDFTSNLGSGGSVSSFDDWFQSLASAAQIELQKNITDLCIRIPQLLETDSQRLFELGLDFGFDHQGSLWLLEANSKPGRKVVTSHSPSQKEILAKAPIEYCEFLQRSLIKKGS
ncbi:YheC/YheD family protein [Bacillaceae bacterium IKA-2]|nr:YheC/YheD family protein [Bacillaceae bacterium IKA-2]